MTADSQVYLRRAADLAGVEVRDWTPPAERDAVLDGMRLRYLDWGTRGLLPVVFLHGGGLTCRTWDLVCLALRDSYHCLAVDLRGHGDSDWSPELDYRLDAYVGDLGRLVELLRLERFVLVGMSLGGLVTIAYGGRNPERLAGVVLVDVGPTVQGEGARRVRDFMALPSELDSVEDFVERALSFNPRRDAVLLRQSLLHNLRRLPSGKWTWKYDRRSIDRGHVEDFEQRGHELWECVGRIACPALVVRGAESNLFSDEDAERLAEAFPRAELARVEGAGHTVQGDNPAELVAVLRRFLRPLA